MRFCQYLPPRHVFYPARRRALTRSTHSNATKCYVGDTGRRYNVVSTLQSRPGLPHLDVLLAKSEDESYVIKQASPSIFEHIQEMQRAFPDTKSIRLPIDWNVAERILVFRYFTEDLFDFIRRFPDLPYRQRVDVLWRVLKCLHELHEKDWLHADIKAHNVVLMWNNNSHDEIEITEVMIIDTDLAARLTGGKLVNARLGNPMWRAPEAQVGVGVGLQSDIYSFGILCYFCLFGDVPFPFHISLTEMEREGVQPGVQVLFDTASYIGSFPNELLEYIKENQMWYDRLVAINQIFLDGLPRKEWLAHVDVDTYGILTKMLQLDPAKRPTTAQLLQDGWWERRKA